MECRICLRDALPPLRRHPDRASKSRRGSSKGQVDQGGRREERPLSLCKQRSVLLHAWRHGHRRRHSPEVPSAACLPLLLSSPSRTRALIPSLSSHHPSSPLLSSPHLTSASLLSSIPLLLSAVSNTQILETSPSEQYPNPVYRTLRPLIDSIRAPLLARTLDMSRPTPKFPPRDQQQEKQEQRKPLKPEP